MISLTLLAGALDIGAQIQSTEGFRTTVGITELLSGHRLGIEIGHSIGSNWSVSGTASIKITGDDAEDKDVLTNAVSCSYWPYGTYKGPCLFMDIKAPAARGYSLYAGIGYMCSIWKGLMLGASWRHFLCGNIPRRPQDERLTISVYYGF